MTRKHQTAAMAGPRRRPLLPLLCAGLSLAIIVSSLSVVYSTFETRRATQQLEELRREAADLQVQSGQYLLEKSTLGAYIRVEAEAETKLEMRVPAVENLEMVRR